MTAQLHIPILKSFDELKFNLGKKTLADFIKGDRNSTIDKNRLDEFNSYGCLYKYDKTLILSVIEELIKEGYLELAPLAGGYFVVKRTVKGLKEIHEKKFEYNPNNSVFKSKNKMFFEATIITDDDKKKFEEYNDYLFKFNDEQKKAIVANSKNILCIAGAGSGKTTVLTKRIEFLIKYNQVKQEKILAITFTKKAKEEMQKRLVENSITNVKVETFNSFCEKNLKKYGNLIYTQNVNVASFKDKIAIVRGVVQRNAVDFSVFFEDYFNKKQVREKTPDELFFIFVNDIFTIIDYYKNSEEEIKLFYENETTSTKKRVAKLIYTIAVECEKELRKKHLRDFSDQVCDTLRLFRLNNEIIPKFDHILVDEFQDVNLVQFELLKLLNSENIFAVGDPRQAIYGWRGSDIKYVLDFPKKFENTLVVQLKKNYRSVPDIVHFSNLCIKSMGLENIESAKEKVASKSLFLIEQENELLERVFVMEAIKNSKNPRNEIFVLARTNKILESFAEFFMQQGIKYVIKSEEEYKMGEPKTDEVVLATVHSIKGMEAKEVYIVNANSLSFPNKVQDNFVFALMKNESDYDKESEELRLFYVAISRSKEKLVVTFSGNFTKFISDEMQQLLEYKSKNKSIFEFTSMKSDGRHETSDLGGEMGDKKLESSNATVLKNMLKDWRNSKANELDLPVYMIISNQAIEEISKFRPMNKNELIEINGIGEVKIAKYGDEILRIING